ncbi:Uncharacterized protein TCAP_06758 [Tolypocladium capitatum]|uniref:Aminoglycoside phosphotransferase domain-containing protein n=1 Tax=Tolypocladium capitatum TaxID=45235 RepID=A0A2K3Q6Z9_9HYPO|nr:Uncharacterized protein TCAP_06758 [Tolypocladium capitatum]
MDNGTNDASASKPRINRILRRKPLTLAARWNTKLLRGLEAKLKADPEADLGALLPENYTETPRSHKKDIVFRVDDIRSKISPTPCAITSELSADLKDLLRDRDLPRAVMDLLARAELIYQSAGAASAVFRVSQGIVVKITDKESASTELGSLLYLQEHLPAFLAPRPHGLIRIGLFYLLFTTLIPGLDLERAWPHLDDKHKKSISIQVDRLLTQLRSLSKPGDLPLGGVQGEGCKDARRGLRVNKEPIMDAKQFQDFIFSRSASASLVYIQLLRDLVPISPRCVFTHSDIRPANIMVEQGEDGTWEVVAIIDWEASGFYPEYWESVKMTNTLTPRDNDDWYKYLPGSSSPQQYASQRLVDRLWDRNLVNS